MTDMHSPLFIDEKRPSVLEQSHPGGVQSGVDWMNLENLNQAQVL